MNGSPIVIKIGGNELSKPEYVRELAQSIASLHRQRPCILVHGGGRMVDALMDRLGIMPTYVNGQRVTDKATLEAVEMVLCGQINKLLALALLEAGADALGMSGVDRGLLRVEPWDISEPDQPLGSVGRIVSVRADVLLDLCAQGVVPVISPISVGPGGRYNVNADHAAGAIAGAVGAVRAVFVTNVPGVQLNSRVVAQLTAGGAHRLIAEGVIHGGMIPKVSAALNALACGAREAVVTDLRGLRSGVGTSFVA